MSSNDQKLNTTNNKLVDYDFTGDDDDEDEALLTFVPFTPRAARAQPVLSPVFSEEENDDDDKDKKRSPKKK